MLGVVAQALGAQYDEVLTASSGSRTARWSGRRRAENTSSSGSRRRWATPSTSSCATRTASSAAIAFAELAAVLRANKTTVLAHLEGLYRRYGLFTSSQVNITKKGVQGMAELRALMKKLRDNPPWTIGDHSVAVVRDYLQQVTVLADGTKQRSISRRATVLAFELASEAASSRVRAAPSRRRSSTSTFASRSRATSRSPRPDARAATTMKKLSEAFVAIATG